MKNDVLNITSELRCLEYAGIDISYYVTGAPSEVTLVLIPGWAGAIEFWYKQIEFFSKDWRVLVIDIPSFGHSNIKRQIRPDDPDELSMDMLAAGISKVILHEEFSSCVIVGHSIGGSIALCVGAQNPNMVKCVIGADSFTHLSLYPALPIEDAQAFVGSLEGDFESSVHALAESYFSDKSDPEQKDYVCNTMSVVTPEPALMILQNFLVSDLDAQLSAYLGPVHSIVSAETFEESAFFEKYADRINVIPTEDTCHFIMMDKPELFNNTLMSIIFEKFSTT